MKEDKDNHLKKGVIWTIADRFSVVIMQFVAMMLLARMIAPESFALIGIALFFITISQVLIDSGMGGSLLKKKEVLDIDYSTLFVYNMGVAIGIYILILLLAPLIEKFYNIAGLANILSVIGISVIISAFGKIQNIILFRNLKFGIISKISIYSSFIALLVSIILAYYGFGVWALVIQSLVYSLSVVVFQFFFNRYIPKLAFDKKSFQEQWEFGGNLLYSKLIYSFYNNIFLVIFPKLSSLNFSGLYTQANKIQQIPTNIFNSIIQGVAFPVMSKIESERELFVFARSFSRKVYLIGFSIFLFTAIYSEDIILLILGKDWVGASSILTIICFVGIGILISSVNKNIFKVVGLTQKIFHYEVYNSLIGLLLLAITFAFGEYVILYGMVVSVFISNYIFFIQIAKVFRSRVKVFLYDVAYSLIPIIFPALILMVIKHLTLSMHYIYSLLIGVPVFFISIIFFGLWFKNKETEFFYKFLKNKIKK